LIKQRRSTAAFCVRASGQLKLQGKQTECFRRGGARG
jgi:hypothetical protein